MDRTSVVIAFVCQPEKRKRLISDLKKKYSALRIIPVICMGKINPAMLFRLIVNESRGVILIGCDPSDCHYREGTFFSDRRFFLAKETLKGFGFDEKLLHVIWSNPGKNKAVMSSIDSYMQFLNHSFTANEGETK